VVHRSARRRTRRAAGRRAQRGAALLGLLAVAVMVFAYVLTSRLNAASQFVGIDREHNAKVLAQAKRALVGWMAMNAAGTDDNPGRLPCPEAPGDFNTVNEGRAAGSCMPPNNVGRLPWRTLGLEKLVDAAGEPLWYAVSQGWSLPGVSTTSINSDSSGQLSLNGAANDAVALVIAPGAALSVQAGGGCTAQTQERPVAGPPDVRDYLECGNDTAGFVTSAAGQTFNDQVLRVAAADVIPALEAAIADRVQREIAPALRTVFQLDSNNPRRWVSSSSSPLYPYPAPFTDPGTSNYQGAAGLNQGLLPVNTASSMVAYASTPADAIETLGWGSIEAFCSWESSGVRFCYGGYYESSSEPWRPIRVQMTATFTNVAMGLRALDSTRLQVRARDDPSGSPWVSVPISYWAEMNDGSSSGKPRGSVTIRTWADLPNIDAMGWGSLAIYEMRIDQQVITDHPVVNPNDPTFGWFVRNQWHRVLYYAAAAQSTADGLPSSSGCTSSNCLRFNDSSLRNIRALLVLAGRAQGAQTRPSSNPADYVENQNADLGTVYEQRPIRRTGLVSNANAPWNDRVVLVDWIGSLSETQQIYPPQPVALTDSVRVRALP
jgi:hypothetical protein